MSRSLTVDAIIIHDGRIVLIKRRDGPFKGRYALPGGYVERGEDAKEALAREVEEETGLIVTPGRMVGFYDDPKRDRRGNVSIAFLCRIEQGKAMPGSDSTAVESFPLSRLPGRIAFDHGKMIDDAVGMIGKKQDRGARVLAGGTFNIVHAGHLHFLKQAKELGDELVVVVASDKTVKRNKKSLLFPAAVRAGMVESLEPVDRVVIGDDADMMRVVRLVRPDVIALGYDQDREDVMRQLRDAGITCRVVRLGKLKGYSTKRITGG